MRIFLKIFVMTDYRKMPNKTPTKTNEENDEKRAWEEDEEDWEEEEGEEEEEEEEEPCRSRSVGWWVLRALPLFAGCLCNAGRGADSFA